VADRLYFSCWVKDTRTQLVLYQYEKLLARFPFSKLSKRGPVLRVYAIDHTEPPLLEREFEHFPDNASLMEAVLAAAREFMQEDTACELEAAWDLWQYSGDWKLAPARVTLSCFGKAFENEQDDQLRIEFGPDAQFLPMPNVENGLRMGQSNLKSLLHFTNELEQGLSVEKRSLWSESGANFAAVLKQALGAYTPN
jgi:hypothetical protein